MKLIDEVADYMISKLKPYFTIHRYNAYSTNSVYLKLDWGACSSVRIGDHEGKPHLKYKYNIGLYDDHWNKDRGCWRYYCNIKEKDSIDELIDIIMRDKAVTQQNNEYDVLIEMCKSKIDKSKGFWKDAYLIK